LVSEIITDKKRETDRDGDRDRETGRQRD